jgi:uncharacterized protein (TIRG00374 family)
VTAAPAASPVLAPARSLLTRILHPPRWVQVALSVVLVLVVVRFIVVPQYASAVTALSSLESLSVPLVAVAVLLELASLAVFSGMTATVLGHAHPKYKTLLRIDLTDLGVNHVVPGGGATAAALRFGLLRKVGVAAPDALSAAAIEGSVSVLMLGLVFLSGLVLTVARTGSTGADTTAVALVGVFFAIAAFVVWMLLKHVARSTRIMRAVLSRIPLLSADATERFVLILADRVRTLGSSPRRLAVLVVLGAANWLLDAASLWVVLLAFGAPVDIGALLTVYGVGSVLAMLPITPGGLGIVEGVMVPALVLFGVSAPIALLGVVGWRVLEFWLPIPLAGAAYLSLRLTDLRHPVIRT